MTAAPMAGERSRTPGGALARISRSLRSGAGWGSGRQPAGARPIRDADSAARLMPPCLRRQPQPARPLRRQPPLGTPRLGGCPMLGCSPAAPVRLFGQSSLSDAVPRVPAGHAMAPRPGVTLQPSQGGFLPEKGGRRGRGGSEQGCWQGFVLQHLSLPPSRCSRALAAMIPCSGLKISPGAAAAHRRLEVVINNPGGGSRWPRVAPALPSCCGRRSEPPSSPCRWRGRWTDGGVQEKKRDGAASAPWPRGETEAQVGTGGALLGEGRGREGPVCP